MNWRRLVLPGLSGLLVGAVAVVAGKRHHRKRLAKPRPVPEDAASLRIETQERPVAHHGESFRSRVVYVCKPTRFRVWSLLDKPVGEGGPGGTPIYSVAPVVELRGDSDSAPQTLAEPRFYATLHYRPEGRAKSLPDHLALGAPVEFHKCHVGGSMNGIDTGERVVTTNVTSFKFDFDQN